MMDLGGLGSLLPSPTGLRNSARGWRSFAESALLRSYLAAECSHSLATEKKSHPAVTYSPSPSQEDHAPQHSLIGHRA
jgi:hypothetical protein